MDQTDTTAEPGDEAIVTVVGSDRETGFATDGEWPINHRLRAEAMARAGVSTDPGGVVTDELIADTKTRLATEGADAARNTPSLKWTRDDLIEEAARRGVATESDANKSAILAAIETAQEG